MNHHQARLARQFKQALPGLVIQELARVVQLQPRGCHGILLYAPGLFAQKIANDYRAESPGVLQQGRR